MGTHISLFFLLFHHGVASKQAILRVLVIALRGGGSVLWSPWK